MPWEWGQLSKPSQRALQFAWAAAQERRGWEPSNSAIDSRDLLVGLLLARPGDSEPAQMFRHFGLVAGQALPRDYPQLNVVDLNRRLAAMPTDQPPPIGSDAAVIVDWATSESGMDSSSDESAQLRAFWAGLLQLTTLASNQVRELLSQRGVNMADLASATANWLREADTVPYSRVLASFPAVPFDLINYKTDQIPQSGNLDDFVGVGAEVDAFAYLLASRSLQPPLAVGLFGDWGSGKTYFMEAIRRRIDQLTQTNSISSRAQREAPFWKRIVQVDFNAWHYVEGDLWSSLVDHIFTQLNLASEKVTDDVVARRQLYLLGQLETTANELKRLEDTKSDLESRLKCQEAEVGQITKERDKAVAMLRAAENARVAEETLTTSLGDVKKAIAGVRTGEALGSLTIGQAMDALASAREELERGRSLLHPLLDNAFCLWALIAAIVVLPLVVVAIEEFGHSVVGAAFAGVSGFIGAAVAALRYATHWMRSQLDSVENAQRLVHEERLQAEKALSNRVEEAQRQVTQTTERIGQLRSRETELKEQLGTIEHALAKRPPELLHDFLRDRMEAGEYRKRLGVPAIIRRDFKALADLIAAQNAFLLAPDDRRDQVRNAATQELLDEDDEKTMNRIILYIDDLDRCPDSKVIEVLQAVHLLLAFPLFVVVVAVDSRWLAHALQTRYPALSVLSGTTDQNTARPDDYLEKIFQIPFWVRPLEDGGRQRIVRGLLSGHLRVEALASNVGGPERPELGEEAAKVIQELVDPRNAPPLLEATALTVTRQELESLDNLAPLMGDTPRSVKRFVNVYQLVKILRRGQVSVAGTPLSDLQVAAFLLAIAEGLPELAWRLFDRVRVEPGVTVLGALVDHPVFAACERERKRLKDWLVLNARYGWHDLDTGRLAEQVTDVERFLFRVASRGGASIVGLRPHLVHVIQER